MKKLQCSLLIPVEIAFELVGLKINLKKEKEDTTQGIRLQTSNFPKKERISNERNLGLKR